MQPGVTLPDPKPYRAAMEKFELWPRSEPRRPNAKHRVDKRLRLARSIVGELNAIATAKIIFSHVEIFGPRGPQPSQQRDEQDDWTYALLEMVRRWVGFLESRPPSIQRLEAELPTLAPELAAQYFDAIGRALRRSIEIRAVLAIFAEEEDDLLSGIELIPQRKHVQIPFGTIDGFDPASDRIRTVHVAPDGCQVQVYEPGGGVEVLFTGTALQQIAEIRASAVASLASAVILDMTQVMIGHIPREPVPPGASSLAGEQGFFVGYSSIIRPQSGALRVFYVFNRARRKALVLALFDDRPSRLLPAMARFATDLTGSWAIALRHVGLEPLTEEERVRAVAACEVGLSDCPAELLGQIENGWDGEPVLVDGNEAALAALRRAGATVSADLVRERMAARVMERFRRLRELWLDANRAESSFSALVRHPAYLGIVALGKGVTPLLIEDMRGPEPMPWGPALEAILGEGPSIPADDRGRLRRIASHWAAWWDARHAA